MSDEPDPGLLGFLEDTQGGQTYTMVGGGRDRLVARVQTFGHAWGYTVWRGNECLGGRRDWKDWTLYDACEHAAKALAEATKGGGA